MLHKQDRERKQSLWQVKVAETPFYVAMVHFCVELGSSLPFICHIVGILLNRVIFVYTLCDHRCIIVLLLLLCVVMYGIVSICISLQCKYVYNYRDNF